MAYFISILFLLFSQFNYDSYRPVDPEVPWKEAIVLDDTDLTIETKEVKYQFDVQYTGKQRELIESRKALFKIWAKSLGFPDEYADLCSREIEIQVNKNKYWIPIQDPLLEPFNDEAKKNSLLRLWVSYIGATDKKRVFIISSILVMSQEHDTKR